MFQGAEKRVGDNLEWAESLVCIQMCTYVYNLNGKSALGKRR